MRPELEGARRTGRGWNKAADEWMVEEAQILS
jgi:hypothetical protein